MAVIIGSTNQYDYVKVLGDTPTDGGPESYTAFKADALEFATREDAIREAFESGILDEAKWGIEDVEPRKFYKTTVVFEVLSEEPIPPHNHLEYIQREATEGRFVGRFGENAEVLISGEAMARELFDFGSEPGFFELDENGETVVE